jgi:hypothetical protein
MADFAAFAVRTNRVQDEVPSAMLTDLMDASIKAMREAEPARDYLGGSRLGETCERRLGYEYTHATPDPGAEFSGRSYRIFERGHRMEDAMAGWLKLAGFDLVVEAPTGGQIGWGVCKDPETGKSRIAGHLDGVIRGWGWNGPVMPEATLDWAHDLPFPLLWEHKALNNANFNEVERKGCREVKPVYFAQTQVYMAYKQLKNALFTVINADNMKVYAEVIPFDVKVAQEASDRGVRVVTARRVEDLPRIGRNITDWACKWCSFKERCFAPKATTPETLAARHSAGWGDWGKNTA